MRQYIALIHKDAGSDYGVSFPDLPGCVTAGVDLDDASARAEEALALHLAGMSADEEPTQEPSLPDAVMADWENRDAVGRYPCQSAAGDGHAAWGLTPMSLHSRIGQFRISSIH